MMHDNYVFFYIKFIRFGQKRGWSGGAVVLGELPVPGRPTSLENSRAMAYCACGLVRAGVVWIFFLSCIISLFFLPLSLGDCLI